MTFAYFTPKIWPRSFAGLKQEWLSWRMGQDNLLKRMHVEETFGTLALTGQEYVLEIGPGSLHYTGEIAKRAKKVMAIDISPGVLDIYKSRQHPRNLSVEIADATNLNFPDTSFDVVFISETLSLLEDAKGCMSEIYRVLKSGGRLLVINGGMHVEMEQVWQELEMQKKIAKAHEKFNTPLTVEEFQEKFFTLHGTQHDFFTNRNQIVIDLVKNAGFNDIETTWKIGKKAQQFYCRLMIEAMEYTGQPVLGAGQVKHLKEFKRVDDIDSQDESGLTMFCRAKKKIAL